MIHNQTKSISLVRRSSVHLSVIALQIPKIPNRNLLQQADGQRAGRGAEWIRSPSFFYRSEKLWQGVLNGQQPYSGQMITHGAGRNGYLAALLESGRYGLAGNFSMGYRIHDELLNQFRFDLWRDTVVGLLSLTPVYKRGDILMFQTAGQRRRMCWRQADHVGHLM